MPLIMIFEIFSYIKKVMVRGYLKFLMDKKMINLEYRIISSHRVPHYIITGKGGELLDMITLIYNVLGV
jgi:hypothetical protein